MLAIEKILKERLEGIAVVICDSGLIAEYLNSPEGFNSTITCVVKPLTIGAIESILNIANNCQETAIPEFAIHPLSTGKNWGYGSSVPIEGSKSNVILDLSSLDSITHFDKENGIVSLQPGVTQQHLFDYLHDNNHEY